MAQDEKYLFALPQGTILAGQYVIEQTLGQGGFGITYRATDHKTGQRVAVKEFFPDSLAARTTATTVSTFPGARGESFVYGKECFLQEAETLAKFIGNEHIVRVYSYFEENGTAYFVMEYVEGTSFDRYIKDQGGKVSYEEAEKILLPIIDALAVVHAKGIVHRDVTPDNIYITKDGTVKLLDFGAARYSLGDKSRSLDVVLKHGFAPKEQYTRHGRQGAFTDVYTVGASFYFAITGKRPPDSIDRMDEDELIPPSSLVRIPPEKEDAILKAMSVQPANRYQTMVDFREALMRAPGAGVQNLGIQAGGMQNAGMQPAAMPLQGAAAAQEVPPQPVQQRVFTAPQPQPEAEAKLVQQISQSAKQTVYVSQQDMSQAHSVGQSGMPELTETEPKNEKSFLQNCVYEYNSNGTAMLKEAHNAAGALNIPATVKYDFQTFRITCIGSNAFKDCSSLTSTTIPAGVTEIGDRVFYNCSSLTSITIPAGVTEIGDRVFYNCSSLTSITIPVGVTEIRDWAFYNCSNLASIELPDSVTEIKSFAFYRCNSLTSIELPDSVTSIWNHAFENCSNLTSITIPDNVTSIGDSAFKNCSRLTSITIPDGVTSIGDEAFKGCSSLTTVVYGDRQMSLDEFLRLF